MLAKLKKLLSECHFEKNDMILKAIIDADYDYVIRRAEEELIRVKHNGLSDNEDSEKRLKLCIQLLNLGRMKLKCIRSKLSPPPLVDPKV